MLIDTLPIFYELKIRIYDLADTNLLIGQNILY